VRVLGQWPPKVLGKWARDRNIWKYSEPWGLSRGLDEQPGHWGGPGLP
jgi:hypothetical protein